MTSESRMIVGVEDIKALSLECNKCSVRLTYTPDTIGQIPYACPNPNCGTEWRPQEFPYSATEPAMPLQLKLLHAIAGIRRRHAENKIEQPNQKLGFRVLLEFDEPK
jgi:hypothetical protein